MSTAIVSAFYDVDEVLLQNRKNLVKSLPQQGTDRRVVGTPITGNTNRNYMMQNPSVNRTAPINNNNNVISTMARHGSPVLGNRELLTNNNQISGRKFQRSVSEPASEMADKNSKHQLQGLNINSSRYKTELCRPFEENGYCKYGDKCQFAHGIQELRCLARHPKYKTELCRTFHTIGFCPYGPRCHFVHSEDEGKLNQINQLKQSLPPSPQPHGGQQSQGAGQVQPPQHVVSQAQTIQRPRALFNQLSLAMIRDSMGSTADSPPSSVTDSPTMSPTFGEDFLSCSSRSSAFSPGPATAPPGITSAFTFPHHTSLPAPVPSTPLMAPLNVQTDPIASLTAGLRAATLAANNQRNNNTLRDNIGDVFYAPPSPPDSLSGESITSNHSNSTCGSPLEVSRGLRLPIFSRLSVNDE